MKGPEKGKSAASERRDLLWEGEPVLSFSPPGVMLPAGTPRRVARYYRGVETAWLRRWEGVLYRRACEAARTARERSRPFEPWSAGLTAEVTREEARLLVHWEAEECSGGPRYRLSRTDVWQLPGGMPELSGKKRREKRRRKT